MVADRRARANPRAHIRAASAPHRAAGVTTPSHVLYPTRSNVLRHVARNFARAPLHATHPPPVGYRRGVRRVPAWPRVRRTSPAA
jgi:hypothetical protein